MSVQCFRRVKDWAEKQGMNLPDSLIREMGVALDRLRQNSSEYTPTQFRAEVEKITTKWAERMRSKAPAEKLFLSKLIGLKERVLLGAGDKATNLKHALFGGSTKAGLGSNISPKSLHDSYFRGYLSMLRNLLNDEQVKLLEKNVPVDDVFKELDHIQNKRSGTATSNADAHAIAQAIDTLNAKTLMDKKSVNPLMGAADDYFIHRSWDRERVSLVSEQEFIDFAFKNYGEKSFPGLDVQEKYDVFRNIYNDIKSGANDEFRVSTFNNGKLSRMAVGRKLVANDWKAEAETFKKFGKNTLGEAIGSSLYYSARDVSIMEKFTHKPEEYISRGVEYALKDDPKLARETLDFALDAYRGLTMSNAPSNTLGKITQTLKTAEVVFHGGTFALSSMADLPMAAAITSPFTGKGTFSGNINMVKSVIGLMTDSKTRNDVLASMGMCESHAIGIMNDALGFNKSSLTAAEITQLAKDGKVADALHSGMSKAGELMGKMNLMSVLHDATAAKVSLNIAEGLGKISQESFSALSPELKNNLLRYGAREAEWNFWRSSTEQIKNPINGDTVTLVTPRSIEKTSNEVVIKYLQEKGEFDIRNSPTAQEAEIIKRKLSIMYSTMVNDSVDIGTSTPSTWERNLLVGKSSVNDWWGATRHLVTQFKSSAYANMRNAARIAYSGADPLKADMAGLASYGAAAFTMGMLINWTKDALKGQTPQDPTDASFLLRSAASSGLGGIYADVLARQLTAENQLMGKLSTATSLAGPVIGDVIDAASIAAGYGQAAKAAIKGEYRPKAPNKDAVNFVINKTPNIIFFKSAVDYYFLNAIREAMKPGTMMNMEQRTRKRGGVFTPQQENFMFKPTESNLWMN